MSTDATVRIAADDDLPAIAEVYLAARDVAAMPPGIHPPDDVRAWVGTWDLTSRDVWVAESGGPVVAFANLTPTWLDGLYVAPGAQRGGIGSTLVDVAKSVRPAGFGLWVFEMNEPARGFYRRHGLVELERTDGSANEEHAPDIKMVWPGADPLAYFRSLIDDADLVLGDVLARRAALTRAVQEHKRAVSAVADPDRDEAREREIVERIAAMVPELGSERVARIMHAIISASLDASR
ncbi:GNAT family N-acetyltransferase [Nocardioides sp.]|uniref:GNAT family N-acetyltransferase n=1 Tax=Nocardioides sp. TaxID=35761 RepID=UPI00286DBFD1|nr:GNAT family N-acetyltransferase [Nocardioides sp.]